MKKTQNILIILFCIVLFSCKTKEIIITKTDKFKFKQKADEIIFKPSFISFIKSNPYASFVLRSPNSKSNMIEEEQNFNRSIYFQLEKTLTKENFVVRDRNIFLNQNEKVKDSVDFIIEIISYKKEDYATNKRIEEISKQDKKEEEEFDMAHFYHFTGGVMMVKIVNTKNNEIVACLTLNYTPCLNGCYVRHDNQGNIFSISGDELNQTVNHQVKTESGELDIIVKTLTKRFVDELRKIQQN